MKPMQPKLLNRKATFEYHVIEKLDLGIVLHGWEVKALRLGAGNIASAYLDFKAPHVVIHGMHITGNALEAERSRIMLVKKKERNKIIASAKMPGQTIVPLELYWNKKGIVKLICAIVEGKNKHDKRDSIKNREWKIEKERALKRNKFI